MTSLVARRVYQLAGTIAELKVKVRAVLATELAGAISNAIRDVLVATMLDRSAGGARPSYPPPQSRDRREEALDRNRKREQRGEPHDPWADDDDEGDRPPTRYELGGPEEGEAASTIPAAAAIAVGVGIGQWWLAKKGSIIVAVGVGLIAATLGLAGGPVARTVLSVLTTATDVLTAESILARADST